MSHFAVLVITPEQPSQDDLAKILAPWHEFECTGIDDEYVQDIDKTEEALAEYAKATVIRLKGPDGTLHDRFDEKGEWKPEFSKVDPEWGHGRIAFIPPGFESVEIPASEVETAAKWIKDYYGWSVAGRDPGEETKYGYIELDAAGNVTTCIDRTNPNKKWDWWVLGGRWSGHLRVKEGAEAIVGRPGVMGSRSSDHRLAADQACKREIDFDTPRAEAHASALALWDSVHAAIDGLPAFDDFDAVREQHGEDIAAARDAYWKQPAVAALREKFKDSWGLDREIEAARMDRDAFAQREANSALATFAIVHDGKWLERGEMGWFGMTFNEKDQADWSGQFRKLIDDLPESAWLSVVDCHI